MFERLRERLGQKEYRRMFASMFASKVLGVVVLIVAIKCLIGLLLHAGLRRRRSRGCRRAVPAYVNPINTMWTLIAAFLVFFMQAGFMCLEAGFARTRETVNILLEGIVDTCLCGILFWAFGLRVHVRLGQRLHRPPVLLPARRARDLRRRPASPSSRSGSSSSRSPTPAAPSPRAPWSAAPASSATSSTASA